MEISEGELHTATGPSRSRRSLLKGLGVITVGTVSYPLVRFLPAAAQTEDAGLSDEELSAFAESVELAAVDAYSTAIAGGMLSAPLAGVATAFQGHHREHATAVAAAAGAAAEGKANAKLLEVIVDQLRNATSEKATLQVLLDLENAAAGTYLHALGELDSGGAQRLAASVLPVEAQHAVVIGQAIATPLGDLIPELENQSRGVTPDKFPTVPTTTTTSTTTK